MKKLSTLFTLIAVALMLSAGPVMPRTLWLFILPWKNEEVVEYIKQAKEELPDLDIKAIRLSTGELGARMLAEKNNPQADLVWGWAVTNMEEFVPKKMFKTVQACRVG